VVFCVLYFSAEKEGLLMEINGATRSCAGDFVVNIQVTGVKENPLLHRKELTFEIEHLGQPTPNRLEVRDKLAALQTVKAELTFIKSMQPVFSMPRIQGSAFIYENEETAQRLEPVYFKIRQMPKEKREEAWKAAKAKKKKKKKGGT
jgi:small subunit ribosomal protein S24e